MGFIPGLVPHARGARRGYHEQPVCYSLGNNRVVECASVRVRRCARLHLDAPARQNFARHAQSGERASIQMRNQRQDDSLVCDDDAGSGALTVGCIGGGNMAWAILKGLVANEVLPAESVWVCDRNKSKQQQYQDLGMHVAGSIRDLSTCSVIFLAVKPYAVAAALAELSPDCRALVISVCAGISLGQLADMLPAQCSARLARVMPNTPCLVGHGASAFALGPSATDQDAQIVQRLFQSISLILKVDESMLDAVTGLSGSGPAYVLMFIEALVDGGVQNGLKRDTARALASQVVYGTAKMVLDNPDVHVAELRNRVESPGGTTVAGTSALEKEAFRAAVQSAVRAATARSKELK